MNSIFWDITPSPDVSEEHIASIFEIKEQAKQETTTYVSD
jgi:hypothetical protein